MMESTKSYVTVYDISLTQAEDFEFTFSTGDSEILMIGENLLGELNLRNMNITVTMNSYILF